MPACARFEPFVLRHAHQHQPKLNKPLVTLEKGRIKHLSNQAEKQGVEVGMTLDGARACCGNLMVIETNEATLQHAWQEVLDQLYTFTSNLEAPRPGLVFLELKDKDAKLIAQTFNARVAHARSQEHAYLLTLVTQEGEVRGGNLDLIPTCTLTALGLSPKTIGRLNWLGVTQVGQLRRWGKAQLSLYLAGEAKVLVRYLHGPFKERVAPFTPPVTMRESFTFEEAALEPRHLTPVLELLAARLLERLGDKAAARLTLEAQAGGLTLAASRVSKGSLRNKGSLYELAASAFYDSGAQGLGVTTLTLGLSGLYRPYEQDSLWQRKESIARAVRQVNARFPGALFRFEEVNPYAPVPEFSFKTVVIGDAKRGGL